MKTALTLGLLLSLPSFAAPAFAQTAASDEPPESLGMDPSAPQSGALPGGMQPGGERTAPNDWRFDFHGMFTAPLRVGFNSREEARPGQSKLVLHSPPVVPDDLETFSHTGVVPIPYAQLNFSYGTSVVVGTASIVAKVPSISSGFFDPSAQLGVNDLFLTITPDFGTKTRLALYVGAFSSRYGSPGEYDEGRYGTPLIARTNGIGEAVSVSHRIEDFTLHVEQGIQGQTGSPSNSIVPDGSNAFADAGVGASFVHHFHLGVGYAGYATLGGHYLAAGSQDDLAGANQADGRMDIFAADLRLTLKRFGHFYFALSYVDADNVRSVGQIVEVLNTRGGPGLMDNYLGRVDEGVSRGTGSLLIMGGQYDLSIGRLVSYPVPFSAGPDVFVSAFGLYTGVSSDDPSRDGRSMYKAGLEGTYSLLPWFAFSTRYDRVTPNSDDNAESFAVLSPRAIFRTDWQARDQVVLQYSHWFNGDRTTVRVGYPPREDVSVFPDEDMISLTASMWW